MRVCLHQGAPHAPVSLTVGLIQLRTLCLAALLALCCVCVLPISRSSLVRHQSGREGHRAVAESNAEGASLSSQRIGAGPHCHAAVQHSPSLCPTCPARRLRSTWCCCFVGLISLRARGANRFLRFVCLCACLATFCSLFRALYCLTVLVHAKPHSSTLIAPVHECAQAARNCTKNHVRPSCAASNFSLSPSFSEARRTLPYVIGYIDNDRTGHEA